MTQRSVKERERATEYNTCAAGEGARPAIGYSVDVSSAEAADDEDDDEDDAIEAAADIAEGEGGCAARRRMDGAMAESTERRWAGTPSEDDDAAGARVL